MNTWAKFSGGFSFREVKSWPTSTDDEAGEDILTLSSWCNELLGEDTDVGGGDEWVGSKSWVRPIARWDAVADEDTGGKGGAYPA